MLWWENWFVDLFARNSKPDAMDIFTRDKCCFVTFLWLWLAGNITESGVLVKAVRGLVLISFRKLFKVLISSVFILFIYLFICYFRRTCWEGQEWKRTILLYFLKFKFIKKLINFQEGKSLIMVHYLITNITDNNQPPTNYQSEGL